MAEGQEKLAWATPTPTEFRLCFVVVGLPDVPVQEVPTKTAASPRLPRRPFRPPRNDNVRTAPPSLSLRRRILQKSDCGNLFPLRRSHTATIHYSLFPIHYKNPVTEICDGVLKIVLTSGSSAHRWGRGLRTCGSPCSRRQHRCPRTRA